MVASRREVGLITYEEYHPYGTTSWWASNGSTEVSAKRYRYTGKEKDAETGLAYHGARYLMTWLGRWERPDPKPDPKWSRYEYCRCSPTNHVDADGAEPQDVVGAAIWEAATWYPKAVMAAHEGLEQGARTFAADPVGTVKAGFQKDVAVAKAGVAVGSAVAADPWKAASDATAFLISHGTVAGIRGQMNAAVQADDVAAGGAAGRDLGAMVTLGMAGEAVGPVAAEAAGPALSRLAKFVDDPLGIGSVVDDAITQGAREGIEELIPRVDPGTVLAPRLMLAPGSPGAMFREALALTKAVPSDQRVDAFKILAPQIEAAHPGIKATPHLAVDGSTVFVGAIDDSLTITREGRLFRGYDFNGDDYSGAIENLRPNNAKLEEL